MDIKVRKAKESDMEFLGKLLFQTAEIHHKIRPDQFRKNTRKYSEKDINDLMENDSYRIFIAHNPKTDEKFGYAFCRIEKRDEDHLRFAGKNLFIEDFCVDEEKRGKGAGRALMEYLNDFALKEDLDSIELNVWEKNETALRFYEKLGFSTQRRQMEKKL